MLTQLSVRNFVLIESLDLELGKGLNVLSGGSGEGKTLLLNALRFVLGQGSNGKAAAARWVRAGADQAKVRVVFECPEGKQVLERTLSAAGRGRCSLNESVLPLPAFRARASRLGEFFGQGQAQRLVEPDAQRELLDSVAGARDLLQRYSSEREELLTRARTHDRLAREEISLRADWGEQQAQREALSDLGPEPGEFEELIERVDRLEAQADQASALAALARDLEGDDSGYGDSGYGEGEGLADAVVNASASLQALQGAWPELSAAHETLLQAAELLQETSRSVASVRASSGFNPQELDSLRRRESEFRSLARRLGLRPEGLAARWQRLRTLDPEEIAAERAALALRLRRGRKDLAVLSANLSAARSSAALSLGASVLARLPELGLGESRFEVQVHTPPQAHFPQLSPSGTNAGPSSAGAAPTPETATCSAAASDPGTQASSISARASYPLGSAKRAPGRRDPSASTGPLPSTARESEEAFALEPQLLAEHPSPHGADRVELRFSANPALPLGGLEQASGGELGRVFLALGLEAPANAALLVFDEVDQNVGARLGTAVGACLERMSHSRQVLAITHLAPVAARARLHHRIAKRSGVTRVETLEGEARVDELALMIRGEPLTEAARAQARELLSEAQEEAKAQKLALAAPTKKRKKRKPTQARDPGEAGAPKTPSSAKPRVTRAGKKAKPRKREPIHPTSAA